MTLFKREYFVNEDLMEEAYSDEPLRFTRMGFNISAPHMHAFCLENLDVQPGNSVLDIGCGSGYITAACAYLAGEDGFCLGLDIHQHIIDFCEKNIKNAQEKENVKLAPIKLMNRNCFLPLLDDMKFDRIHVGARCPESHLKYLYDLLNVGGIIVTPYGDQMLIGKKQSDGTVTEEFKLSVRYGDLTLPSESEIREAKREVEKYRASKIIVPESTFEEDMKSLMNDEKYADIIFPFENGKIYAHRAILSLRSPVFNAMFSSNMKESEKVVQTIKPEGSMEIMEEFLRYLYTDKCDINESNCVELLKVASYYKVDRLINMCELLIKENVSIEEAANILFIADRYGANQLKSFILEYIIDNLDEVMKTESYQQLDNDLINMILLRLKSKLN